MAPSSLYTITIPPFLKQLRMLLMILEKGQTYSAGNEAKILESRLVEDMAPLVFQSKLFKFSFMSRFGIYSQVRDMELVVQGSAMQFPETSSHFRVLD